MPIELRYIKVSELESYIRSEEYSAHGFYPISIPRAISHARNPRSDGTEVALILAYDRDRLVGYLGAIPEKIHLDDQVLKACWFSCMWVLPEYRRAGIAKLLLEEGSAGYNGRVCITNYIPRSKAAFLKNDQFREVGLLRGVRAYLKFDLEHILPRKKKILSFLQPLLWISDHLANLFISLYFKLRYNNLKVDHVFQEVRSIDDDLGKFIHVAMKDSIFKRGADEFRWLFEYPWVLTRKISRLELSKYYFSQCSADFRQWVIRITDTNGSIRGFVILTRHRHELKTPYILCEKDVLPDLFRYIYRLMLKNGVRTLVTQHEDFASEAGRHRNAFLYLRSSEYGFMATPAMVELTKGKFGQLFDGDGDGMFT